MDKNVKSLLGDFVGIVLLGSGLFSIVNRVYQLYPDLGTNWFMSWAMLLSGMAVLGVANWRTILEIIERLGEALGRIGW